MQYINVEAIKVRNNAKELKYAHGIEDSGMDLHVSLISVKGDNDWLSFNNYTLAPNEIALIKTGWKLKIPAGYEFQVRPTSGNSLKTKLRIANSPGTIDSGYEDEIGVIVENLGDTPIVLTEGKKIAQLVLAPIFHAKIILTDSFTKKSKRGTDGYGSSGTILDE